MGVLHTTKNLKFMLKKSMVCKFSLRKVYIKRYFLYLFWKMLLAIASGKGLVQYFDEIITVDSIKEVLLFNESPFNGHLWYLGALFYALIIIYMFNKLNGLRILFYITPLLLITDLILGKYSCVLFGREFPVFYVRNFLFVGIPYIIIGIVLKRIENKISNIYKHLPILGILIFSASTICERYILDYNKLNATRDHYISTTFLSISVFIFFTKIFKNKSKISNVMSKIGRDYSLGIYILHPIIMTVIGKVFKVIGMYQIYEYIRPIVIYIVSIIVISSVIKTMKLLKKLK